MSSDSLDALDPLPIILSLVKNLHNSSSADDVQILADTTRLKTMLRQARAELAEVPHQSLSLHDQEEIIQALREKVALKRQLLSHLEATSVVKVEEETDVAMMDTT